MTIRAYLPSTIALLAAQHADGEVVVTDQVVVVSEGDEESEYDALMDAAVAAAARLDGPGRRVVVVAEVDSVVAPISLDDVVAVHCDVEDRPDDADADDDLAWFATQEIPGLV